MSEKFLDMVRPFKPDESAPPALIIDSNVMLEIYSVGDLLREVDKLGTPDSALRSPTFRWRQRRAQHSIILAWWLAKKRIPAGIHGNEVSDLLTSKLAPITPKNTTEQVSFGVTSAIFHVIFDFVLVGHAIGPLTEVNHQAKGTAADTELLQQAQKLGVPIITNEGVTEAGFDTDPRKLRTRCIAAGVKVYTPEEYLKELNVNVDEESRKFIFSLRKGVRTARAKDILVKDGVLDHLEGIYRFILLNEVDPAFAHVPRPPAREQTRSAPRAEIQTTDAFETVFTRTTAGYFLREFCFSSTQFTPPSQTSEVELADFVIQLGDLVMVFQVKEREEPTTDPETERTWFERKVIKKATQQIRDTIKYLQNCPPEIANDRGRRIALPTGLDATSVVKIVVFKGCEHLPPECARHRFHDSKTAGFIHVIAAEDWAAIMNTLVTPREIGDYMHAREHVCRAHGAEARSLSEKALVGQFIAEDGKGTPSADFETAVDRLVDETASFDMLAFLNLFPDRITVDAPPGLIKPTDMSGAGTDYYSIILEIAKLPRTDLAAFKTRFGLAWQRAGKFYDPPFMRMVSSTGVGFVFAPIPEGLEAQSQNGLMNFVAAHMYDQRIRRCIGASFVHEGEWRLISWVMLDQEWQQNPEMERYLREHPLSSVREEFVPRYRLVE